MTMTETCKQCSTLGACPFSFTEESEIVQNYGCLPTPYQIIHMRTEHGKTWACHSNPTKPCLGALKYMQEEGIECHVIDPELQTEKTRWDLYVE
jgi:hypothetical protein